MSTAFELYKSPSNPSIATIPVLDITEYTSKEGKPFCIISTCYSEDIACTDLIYKQLREQPILWTNILEITLVSLTSKSTGRKYFMISSYKTDDNQTTILGGNESYKDVIEYLNEYVESSDVYNQASGVTVLVDEVLVKDKLDDGHKYQMYTLGIGDKVNLKLTVRMNKELSRLSEQYNMGDLSKLTFKCIGGLWKIVKVIFK